MIQCNNVTKVYHGITAVNNFNMTFEDGGVYAMLGSNGSGKTTLMKMIAGLTTPSSGTISINGVPVGLETKPYVAYMPTESYFYSYMTAKDVGKFYKDFFTDFSIDNYYSFLSSMELQPNMKVSTMSSGMMAKLKIAATLSRNSYVIMLDEPFNGIDVIARERIANTIKAYTNAGRIFLMSSHLVEELELISNHAIFIRNGNMLAAGPIDVLRTQSGMSLVDQYKMLFA